MAATGLVGADLFWIVRCPGLLHRGAARQWQAADTASEVATSLGSGSQVTQPSQQAGEWDRHMFQRPLLDIRPYLARVAIPSWKLLCLHAWTEASPALTADLWQTLCPEFKTAVQLSAP